MTKHPRPASHAHAIDTLRRHLGDAPLDWAVVAGSGLGVGFVAEQGGVGLAVEGRLPLAELGLPAAKVAGHGNELVWGRVGARRVCVQTGRVHPYEGHPAELCVAPLAAMLACGARAAVLTFAVGGLDPMLGAGQIVALRDQIALFGPSPLVGAQFVDCSEIYSPHLRRRLHQLHPGIDTLPEVVYAHARGPQYETPAETEALRRLGGQVVGMSTTYEAVLCAAHRVKYGAPHDVALAGVGIVSNTAGQSGLSHEEVQERVEESREQLTALLHGLLAGAPGEH